jgi:cyclopropane-fatty-acyl-phospholipid synthase
MALHQVLATRPNGEVDNPRGLRGAQSVYPFTRDHVYADPPGS